MGDILQDKLQFILHVLPRLQGNAKHRGRPSDQILTLLWFDYIQKHIV